MEYWSISGDAGDGVIVRCIRDTDGPYATAGSLMALVWNVGAWVEMLEVGSLYSALRMEDRDADGPLKLIIIKPCHHCQPHKAEVNGNSKQQYT